MDQVVQIIYTDNKYVSIGLNILNQLQSLELTDLPPAQQVHFIYYDHQYEGGLCASSLFPTLILSDLDEPAFYSEIEKINSNFMIVDEKVDLNFTSDFYFQLRIEQDQEKLLELFFYFFKFFCKESLNLNFYDQLFSSSHIQEGTKQEGDKLFNFSSSLNIEDHSADQFAKNYKKLKKKFSGPQVRNLLIELLYQSSIIDIEKDISQNSSLFPYIIFKQGAFVSCNQLYSSLKVNFNHDDLVGKDEIVIQQNIFKIFTFAFSEESKICFLVDTEYEYIPEKFNNMMELGVISSSIAHEINNPLASILAFADLLSLEATDDSEKEAILSDIKKAVLKCSQIVDLFLGFGRTSLAKDHDHLIDLKKIIFNSKDLLRSRLAEDGFNLNLKFYSDQSFNLCVDENLLTMYFYLLFDGIITRLNQLYLVQGTPQASLNNFVIQIEESTEWLKLLIPVPRTIISELMEKNLEKNILKTLSLKFSLSDVTDNQVKFILEKI